MDLEELFTSFNSTAFRLEGLPAYAVEEEEEAFEYFRLHGRVPRGFNEDWAQLVAEKVRSGKSMHRLRLRSFPPSEYERFELMGYRAGTAAGEEIRLIDRAGQPFVKDFWLFDGRWLATMNYSDSGEWESATVTDTHETQPSLEVDYWLSLFSEARPFDLGDFESAAQ